ncbi:5675_t:CDS:2 [Acaulospora morrowiae]|uniref:5675_t:CDS:1 n=1 Tax=Acaulospora morrowiae TaxID=94023 RepID=A0A9N8VW40_9GLOM|nr:5675_t:CDS:2 [Acaulospora morrowiae]
MTDKAAEVKENIKEKIHSVNPPQHAPTPEKIASPLVTLSSHTDPYPHYFMCAATLIGSGYAHQYLKQPRTALVAAAIGAAYGVAGAAIHGGNHRAGYSIASLASVALVGTSGPKAWAAKEPLHAALASLGAVSTAGNTLKLYQIDKGRPRELEMRK